MEWRVKLYRKIDEWGRRSKPNTVSLFLYLLTHANIDEKEYQWHTISRGDCIIGRKTTSKFLWISERSLRTSLEHLKTTSEIAIKTTNKFSIITVVWFDKYQSDERKTTSETTNRASDNRPTTDQQPTTPKEYNKERNKEYIYTEDFENFRKVYPRKKWKLKAMEARLKAIRKIEPSKIIESATKYAQECRVMMTPDDKIKRPQWRLNDERRDDEYKTNIRKDGFTLL